MTENEVMSLLLADRRREIEEIRDAIDRERKDCLPVTRAYQIALDPTAATEAERRQLVACAHCARTVEVSRQHLAQAVAGNPSPTDRPVEQIPSPQTMGAARPGG